MKRVLRIAGYVLAGIVAFVLLLIAVVIVLLNTDFVVDRIGRFAVDRFAGQIQGEISIGDFSSDDILSEITAHDIAITGPRGRPFLRADSAHVGYEWRTLLGGRIVLDPVVVYDPEVLVEKLPGDTAWNYERVFADTTPAPDTAGGRGLVLLRDARVFGGRIRIRMPWRPDTATPAEPPDTARLILERVPGGLVRVYRFLDVDAALPRLLWESPIEEGKLFEIVELSTRGHIWERPFLLMDLRATVTVHDSLIAFRAPRVVLPESRFAVVGHVLTAGDEISYNIRIIGERVAFDDLQWLYPPLPEEGGGTLVLRVQTLGPDRTLWRATDARIQAPGTEITGAFGLVTGDTLYFTRLDLSASPLNLDLLGRILPVELPEGLEVGSVEIEGPVS